MTASHALSQLSYGPGLSSADPADIVRAMIEENRVGFKVCSAKDEVAAMKSAQRTIENSPAL